MNKFIEFGTAMTEGVAATHQLQRTVDEGRQPLLEYERETDEVFDGTLRSQEKTTRREPGRSFDFGLVMAQKRRASSPASFGFPDTGPSLTLPSLGRGYAFVLGRVEEGFPGRIDDPHNLTPASQLSGTDSDPEPITVLNSLPDTSPGADLRVVLNLAQAWNDPIFSDWSLTKVPSAEEEESAIRRGRQAEQLLQQLMAPVSLTPAAVPHAADPHLDSIITINTAAGGVLFADVRLALSASETWKDPIFSDWSLTKLPTAEEEEHAARQRRRAEKVLQQLSAHPSGGK